MILCALLLITSPLLLGAIARRLRIDIELTRKLTHMATALACLPLPSLLTGRFDGLLLGASIALIVWALRRSGKLRFLDDAERSHLSEYAFIVGMLLALMTCGQSNRPLYTTAVLSLGFGDAAAALVGRRFGRHGYTVFGSRRSWEGSLAMFGVSIVSALIASRDFSPTGVASALLISAVAVGAEAMCTDGLDNFAIPAVVVATGCVLTTTLTVSDFSNAAPLIAPIVAAGFAHQLIRSQRVLERLRVPLDQILFANRVVFGANKTLRGVVVMPVLMLVTFELERLVLVPVGVTPVAAPFTGLLFGLAHALGELLNSWLKRRLGIAPGAQATKHRSLFFVLDHVDSIGAVALVALAMGVSGSIVLIAFIAGPLIHIAVNLVSHALHVREAAL
jgi:phytol kinase